ncbi:hypothetical protein Adt_42124 [Abeliophyllum distichum]|uniref:Uncharacterized protein n=1 Tax=Abeliophyllum distichum TaxID=126358 RepID=A0ABD1PQS8_9LAMI
MPLHAFETIYLPKKLPKKKGKDKEPDWPTLASLAGTKPRTLPLGSLEDARQKKVVEEISREANRKETDKADEVDIEEEMQTTKGEVSLTKKRKVWAFSQPRKKVVEILDNYVVCNPPSLQWMLSDAYRRLFWMFLLTSLSLPEVLMGQLGIHRKN